MRTTLLGIALLILPASAAVEQFAQVLPVCHWEHRRSAFADETVADLWKAMHRLGATPSVASLLAPLIREKAKSFGVDPLVMVSIARQESNFRLEARGSKGEVGVFQIMPRVWSRELGWTAEELMDPERNTQACAYILSKYLRRYRDYRGAVRAYNHRRYGEPYARTVLRRYEQITAALL